MQRRSIARSSGYDDIYIGWETILGKIIRTRRSERAEHPAFAALGKLLRRYRGWHSVEFALGPSEPDPHIRVVVPSARTKAAKALVEALPQRIHGLRIHRVGRPRTAVLQGGTSSESFDVPSVLQPGFSVRRGDSSGVQIGTCGLLLRRTTDGKRLLVTNHHVLFSGFDPGLGDPVVVPYLNTPVGKIANQSTTDGLDVATAEIFDDVKVQPRQPDNKKTLVQKVRRPNLAKQEKVFKYGVGTKLTFGRVVSYQELTQRFGLPPEGGLRFGILPLIDNSGLAGGDLSRRTDSGSAWIAVSDNAAVGLHVGGDSDDDKTIEYATACDITDFLGDLDLQPLTTST